MRMVSHTRSMEFVVTDSEAEALLLENNLIKRFRPRFNVLLRDDKSFPYIVIRRDTEWPQLAKHRGVRQAGNEYFGPFASATAVNRTLYALQRAFPLRSCSDGVFSTRTRPCLQYQIKRCTAPCVGPIDKPEYDAIVHEVRDFLGGRNREVQQALSHAHGDRRHRAAFRAGCRAARPHPRADPYPVAPVDQPALDRRGRHLRRPCRQRAGLHPGLLPARRPESRQPRLFSQPRQGARPARGPDRLHRPVLRGPAGAEADPDQPRRATSASCWKARWRSRPSTRSRSARPSAATRRMRSTRPSAMRARRWRGAWPSAARSGSCSKAWRACSSSMRRPSGSRSTTTAISRARRRSAR